MLKITETVKEGIHFVRPEGTLDYSNKDQLRSLLDKIIEGENEPKIAVDLQVLEYMSSVGWGVLVDYAIKTKEKKGVMILARMNDRIGRLYDLMGIKVRIEHCSEINDVMLHIFR
jgi:anti-anti-sigma factor